MEIINTKEFLLFALNHFKLEVIEHVDRKVYLEKEYTIEIEGDNLFKLIHQGQVVAPFNVVEEMCNFIKMDISLNEKG